MTRLVDGVCATAVAGIVSSMFVVLFVWPG